MMSRKILIAAMSLGAGALVAFMASSALAG